MSRVISVSASVFKNLPCTVLRICKEEKTTDKGEMVHLSFPKNVVSKDHKFVNFFIGGRGKKYRLHQKHVKDTNW